MKDVSFSNCINRIAKRTSDFLDASERNVMNVVCAPGTAAIVSSCRPAFCLRWRKLFRWVCSGYLAVAFSGGVKGWPVPGDYRICRKRGIGLWRYGFRIFPTDTELFGCAPPELPGVSWIVFATLRMIPTVAPAYSSVRRNALLPLSGVCEKKRRFLFSAVFFLYFCSRRREKQKLRRFLRWV